MFSYYNTNPWDEESTEKLHKNYVYLYELGKKVAEEYPATFFTLSDFSMEDFKDAKSFWGRKKEIGYRWDCKIQLWVSGS